MQYGSQVRGGFLVLCLTLTAGCIRVPPAAQPFDEDGADHDVRPVDTGPDDARNNTTGDMASGDLSVSDAADTGGSDATDVSDFDARGASDAADAADMKPDVPAPPPTALFVAGVPNPLTASDLRATELLSEEGFAVTVADDDTVADANGYDLVVVSKSCSSSTLGAVLADTPTGMLLWENRAQYVDRFDLIFTTNAEYYTWSSSGNVVYVEPEDSAVVGGLSGSVTVHPTNQTTWYVPRNVLAPGAEVVATTGMDEPDNIFVYVYEQGAERPDGTGAPGRRAYVGYHEFTIDVLSDDGETLFKALARWAATQPAVQ